MKLAKFAPIVLLLILSVTAVMASHAATVTINPSEIPMGMMEEISLNVKNTGTDGIVTVQLVIPEVDQKPVYSVQDITTPQGWTYKITTRTGQMYPYRITWTTGGSGIASGQSLNFDMTVQAPSASGNYGMEWLTVDARGGVQTGTMTTRVGTSVAARLKVVTASKLKAGSTLSVTVFAYDNSGRIDSGYTGTVSFASTDAKAILPETYTFNTADNGYKIFTMKLKTAGSQKVTVEDKVNELSTVSTVSVSAGKLVSLAIIPEMSAVNAGEGIVFSAIASDIYGNQIDVTDNTLWDIDNGAGGKWSDSTYTAGNEGIWTVDGTYSTLTAGAELAIGKEIAPTEPVVVPIEVPEEIPVEEEVVSPVEEEPVTPTVALSVAGENSIAVEPGQNDTMVLTVNNDGDTGLTGVEMTVAGVPSDWVLVFPLSSDIGAGESKDYLIIIYVPENVTETQTMTFTATSNEEATAEKEVTLTLGLPPTGLFEAIPKNILQLGVVIIAIAAVVIIGWELWFKK
ncbi:MAG: hypothetical protein ABIE55_01980 [Candidatus Aenigmatarchaeota archaeon]